MESIVETPRLLYLDGLRGIAVVIVYLNHFAAAFFPAIIFGQKVLLHASWEKAFYNTPLGIITDGNYAVYLFIAISVFVMLRKTYGVKLKLRIMPLVGRYLRLMLPILASTLLAYILLRISSGEFLTAAGLSHSSWLAVQWPLMPSIWKALQQGLFGSIWIGAKTYNSNLWMFEYIWYGSLVAFGIGPLLRWPKIRVVFYIAGLILTFTNLFSAFFVGALLCHFQEQLRSISKKLPGIKGLALIFLIIGIALGSVPSIIGDMPGYYGSLLKAITVFPFFINISHFVAASLTLLAIFMSPQIQNLLSRRLLVSMGRMGFSIYLLHVLLITSLASWLLVHMTSLPYLSAICWVFIITSFAVGVVSILFYLMIERPTERFSRWVASR